MGKSKHKKTRERVELFLVIVNSRENEKIRRGIPSRRERKRYLVTWNYSNGVEKVR